MQLSRMQDIGGCRTVLNSVKQVRNIRKDYLAGDLKHVLVNQKDYIAEPKASGYRGIHLIYQYRSDRKQTYNGLLIEVQLRTRIQHAWATAVETVGTFLEQSLKSSQGSAEWLHFFALMGSAFARVEDSPLVPDTPTTKTDLVREARALSRRLEVEKRLVAYGAALQTLEDQASPNAKYFLLALRPAEGTLKVTGYAGAALSQATEDYLAVERTLPGSPGAEAVCTAPGSLDT